MGSRRRASRGGKSEIASDLDLSWPDWVDAAAVTGLKAAIRSGQIGHAYLLAGPRGVGKHALARAFAQALCCTDTDRQDMAEPCGRCRACRNVRRDAHPDVETISLDSQAMLADKPGRGATLSIDTVRRLGASGALLPLESDRRILIVDDAETLLEPAQQALLKSLEEPPRGVTLMLLVDEPELLLDTVRSRCRELVLRPLPQGAVAQAVLRRGVDEPLANETATLSRGCGDWALAAAVDRKLLEARREERTAAARWIASPRYERLVTAFKLGEQFSKRRDEVFGILQAAIELLREEMVATARATNTPTDSARDLTLALTYSRAIAAVLQCLKDLEANVRPRLALEAMVAAWPSSRA